MPANDDLKEGEKTMNKEAQAAIDRICQKDEIRQRKKKIVLALLQQCKDEGMTVNDVADICNWATDKAQQATLRGGLALE